MVKYLDDEETFQRSRHLNMLRQIELNLASDSDVASACRSTFVSDATYYKWRKHYGGIIGRSQLREFKMTEKENSRLKKIVAELELEKLIPKESLDFLKPKV